MRALMSIKMADRSCWDSQFDAHQDRWLPLLFNVVIYNKECQNG
tara:strand:+ start:4808 stop:4939 length:132 start_codon:yes stop_codon:yes gene_type:complete